MSAVGRPLVLVILATNCFCTVTSDGTAPKELDSCTRGANCESCSQSEPVPLPASSLVQRESSVSRARGFEANILSQYDHVGTGWCRDGSGKYTNFYKRNGQTDTSCSQQCDADAACVAYNFETASGQCVILAPTKSDSPAGWDFRRGNGASSISSGSGAGGTTCMKKSLVQASRYGQLAYGTATCAAGFEITTKAECVIALNLLGLPHIAWDGSTGIIPRYCSVQGSASASAHTGCWNSHSTGSARSDQAPICKAGSVVAPTYPVTQNVLSPHVMPSSSGSTANVANSNVMSGTSMNYNAGSVAPATVQYNIGDGSTDTCAVGWQRVVDTVECSTSASTTMNKPFQGSNCYMMKTDGCMTDGTSLFYSTGCTQTPSSHVQYKPVCRRSSSGAAAQYVKGTAGVDECPLGSSRITEKIACSSAAQWAGYSLPVQEGCFQMKTEGCIWSNTQAKALFNTCRMVLTAATFVPLCIRQSSGHIAASSGGFVQDIFNAFDRNRDGQVSMTDVQNILQGIVR